jgi:hypothetical protein
MGGVEIRLRRLKSTTSTDAVVRVCNTKVSQCKLKSVFILPLDPPPKGEAEIRLRRVKSTTSTDAAVRVCNTKVSQCKLKIGFYPPP